MELTRVSRTGLDLSAEAELLNYTYTGAAPIEIAVRVDLGDAAGPILGNDDYFIRLYLDGVLVLPESVVRVPLGQSRAIAVSRIVPVEPAEFIVVRAIGRPGDVAVNTVTSLRDISPVKQSEVTGIGSVSVDHDYGGPDRLAYKTAEGIGIDNAEVLVYLKSDFDVGNIGSQYVKARAITDVDGRWSRAVLLDPAVYRLVYSLQGRYGPTYQEVTVTQGL